MRGVQDISVELTDIQEAAKVAAMAGSRWTTIFKRQYRAELTIVRTGLFEAAPTHHPHILLPWRTASAKHSRSCLHLGPVSNIPRWTRGFEKVHVCLPVCMCLNSDHRQPDLCGGADKLSDSFVYGAGHHDPAVPTVHWHQLGA